MLNRYGVLRANQEAYCEVNEGAHFHLVCELMLPFFVVPSFLPSLPPLCLLANHGPWLKTKGRSGKGHGPL